MDCKIGSRIENNNNNNNVFFFVFFFCYLSPTGGTVKWSILVKTSYLMVINVAL